MNIADTFFVCDVCGRIRYDGETNHQDLCYTPDEQRFRDMMQSMQDKHR